MFLARYGKQSVLQWDDVPVDEINRYVTALADMLKHETTERKLAEDS